MCLAVPGQLVSRDDSPQTPELFRTGRVDFGGIRREVNLACVPEARVGDYVLVHVGLAISVIDAAEAHRVFDYLEAMGELEQLEGER